MGTGEKRHLLKDLDKKQIEAIASTEKFRQVIVGFRETSVEYCQKHCPLCVVEKGRRTQKIDCNGEDRLRIKQCENYKKQNEFFELCFSLLSFLREHLERTENETGS
jgi:hypothetical protein